MANENKTVEQIAVEMMACHMQAVFCEDIRTYGYAVQEANNRQIAAQKREMAAKDAEIARLKRENVDINGCLLAEQELAEERDALIGELADVLNSYLLGECIDCGKQCEGDEVCEHQAKHRELVAKVREVVGENRGKDAAEWDGRAE